MSVRRPSSRGVRPARNAWVVVVIVARAPPARSRRPGVLLIVAERGWAAGGRLPARPAPGARAVGGARRAPSVVGSRRGGRDRLPTMSGRPRAPRGRRHRRLPLGQRRADRRAGAVDPGGRLHTPGDNAYKRDDRRSSGGATTRRWGRFQDRTRPAAGNHDSLDSGAAVLRLLRRRCGTAPGGWYSTRRGRGTWSSSTRTAPGRRVRRGLAQARLAEGRPGGPSAACTVAIWHHPRFSSGEHGNDDRSRRSGRRSTRPGPSSSSTGTTTTTSGSRRRTPSGGWTRLAGSASSSSVPAARRCGVRRRSARTRESGGQDVRRPRARPRARRLRLAVPRPAGERSATAGSAALPLGARGDPCHRAARGHRVGTLRPDAPSGRRAEFATDGPRAGGDHRRRRRRDERSPTTSPSSAGRTSCSSTGPS